VAAANPILLAGILAIAIIAAFAILSLSPGKYDDFARCINERGATMYGSVHCPHCLEQKELFGKSWAYAGYVECYVEGAPGQAQACDDAGITAYPTWVFADGSRKLGMLTFWELSEKTGCPLPDS
jgi:hypothetical protein